MPLLNERLEQVAIYVRFEPSEFSQRESGGSLRSLFKSGVALFGLYDDLR